MYHEDTKKTVSRNSFTPFFNKKLSHETVFFTRNTLTITYLNAKSSKSILYYSIDSAKITTPKPSINIHINHAPKQNQNKHVRINQAKPAQARRNCEWRNIVSQCLAGARGRDLCAGKAVSRTPSPYFCGRALKNFSGFFCCPAGCVPSSYFSRARSVALWGIAPAGALGQSYFCNAVASVRIRSHVYPCEGTTAPRCIVAGAACTLCAPLRWRALHFCREGVPVSVFVCVRALSTATESPRALPLVCWLCVWRSLVVRRGVVVRSYAFGCVGMRSHNVDAFALFGILGVLFWLWLMSCGRSVFGALRLWCEILTFFSSEKFGIYRN